jgi:hypothetical protein
MQNEQGRASPLWASVFVGDHLPRGMVDSMSQCRER